MGVFTPDGKFVPDQAYVVGPTLPVTTDVHVTGCPTRAGEGDAEQVTERLEAGIISRLKEVDLFMLEGALVPETVICFTPRVAVGETCNVTFSTQSGVGHG